MELPTDILGVIRGFLPDTLNICLAFQQFNTERSQGKLLTKLNTPGLDLNWAHSEIFRGPHNITLYRLGRDLIQDAIIRKDLHMALEVLEDAPFVAENAALGSCKHGFLDLLKVVYRHPDREKRHYTTGIEIETAALYGHLDVAEWLCEQGQPCNEMALNAAARGGHTDLVKWMCDHGAKWSDFTIRSAVQSGRLELVQFLRQQGCPWSWNATKAAVEHGQSEILQWLVANGCPWSYRTDRGGGQSME